MSIASALFSKSQLALFGWLFGQPGRRYYLNELRRLTGLGSASLQRELNRLSDAGLILSEREGNLRCFTANPACPVYGELVRLVTKTLGVAPLLCEALSPLQPRLLAACLYGSVARETETARSDIDLMIVADSLSLGEVIEHVLPLESVLGRKINPTCYTHAEYARRRAETDSFVNRVLAQPLVPLIGDMREPAGTR